MSFQGTYAVADLDLENTYNKVGESKEITGRSDISKGTFFFWLNIDREKVRVQISKNCVNIWHSEESYVDGAFEKLNPLIVNADGEKCEHWVLTNKQRIGSTSMATSLTEEVGLSPKIEEADYDDVTGHIEALQNEENPDVLEFRIGKIVKAARSKRITHIHEVLPFFEIALKDAKYQHAKLLRGTNRYAYRNT